MTGLHVLLTVLFLSGMPFAQKQSNFVDPEGEFTFAYPSGWQVCLKGGSCPDQPYIPACDRDALVCVIYRPTAEKTNFGAASFQVKRMRETQHDHCTTPRQRSNYREDDPEFYISSDRPVEDIGGVRFVHGVQAGAATGHWGSDDIYRAFHDDKKGVPEALRSGNCYELTVRTSGTNFAVYDRETTDVREFTPAEYRAVERTMQQVLHTFRFLK